MKTRLLFILMLTLILPPLILSAQESTPEATSSPDTEGWPIVQRCVGEPITPPDNWTYDGTILMTGWAGLHAMNSNREVPYIVAPHSIPGGALSPDGAWYALPRGSISQNDNLVDWAYIVGDLTLYSTDLPIQERRINWDVLFYGGSEFTAVNPIVWLDNERFVYYTGSKWRELNPVTVNLFTEEVTAQEIDISPSYAFFPSNDGMRFVQHMSLYDLPSGQLIRQSILGNLVDWSQNSHYFVSAGSGLWLYDREGNLLDTIFATLEEGQIISVFGHDSDSPNLT